MLLNYMKFMKIQKLSTLSKSKFNLILMLTKFRVCTGGELFDKIVEEERFSEQKAAIVFK